MSSSAYNDFAETYDLLRMLKSEIDNMESSDTKNNLTEMYDALHRKIYNMSINPSIDLVKPIFNVMIYVDSDGVLAKWIQGGDFMSDGYYKNLPCNQGMVDAVKDLASMERITDSKGRVCRLMVGINSCYPHIQAFRDKNHHFNVHIPQVPFRLLVPYDEHLSGVNKACVVNLPTSEEDVENNTELQYTRNTTISILFDDNSNNCRDFEAYGGHSIKVMNGINGTKGTWTGDRIFLIDENGNELSKEQVFEQIILTVQDVCTRAIDNVIERSPDIAYNLEQNRVDHISLDNRELSFTLMQTSNPTVMLNPLSSVSDVVTSTDYIPLGREVIVKDFFEEHSIDFPVDGDLGKIANLIGDKINEMFAKESSVSNIPTKRALFTSDVMVFSDTLRKVAFYRDNGKFVKVDNFYKQKRNNPNDSVSATLSTKQNSTRAIVSKPSGPKV